jgi:hypothetical protein
MDDDSIARRTQMLRRDMELLLKGECHYRSQRSHSLTENAEHEKRRGQLMIIRRLDKASGTLIIVL